MYLARLKSTNNEGYDDEYGPVSIDVVELVDQETGGTVEVEVYSSEDPKDYNEAIYAVGIDDFEWDNYYQT